jgi:hypothetical protein
LDKISMLRPDDAGWKPDTGISWDPKIVESLDKLLGAAKETGWEVAGNGLTDACYQQPIEQVNSQHALA